MSEKPLQGTRGSYAHLICSACRGRKIKCRLPRSQEEVHPSNSPRDPSEACERCRRLDLRCIVTGPKTKRIPEARKHAHRHGVVDDADATRSGGPSGAVKPRLFDQYYKQSDAPSTDTTASNGHGGSSADDFENFRAMLTSANLMSTLLAQDSGFGAAVSSISALEHVPLTETISNGLATLLDESLVWHRFHLPFLPTLTDLRLQLSSGSSASSSTHLLFALLSICALECPSNELYWHQELRRTLQAFVSYHGQAFIYDPPVHRHTVYVLHVVTAYRPTALIACQQSASAAIRGTTHITLAYSIAKSCRFGSAASRLADLNATSQIETQGEVARKALDALLWCRTIIHHILLEGSILKPLSEMESQLESIDNALNIVHGSMVRVQFSAAVISLFHAVRCVCVEMQHYIRMRKARRDLAVLAAIIESHEDLCARNKDEILRIITTRRTHEATKEEFTAAAAVLPLECNQSRARLLTVAVFFAIMAHITPIESGDKLRPYEAARVSKLVFKIVRGPSSQGLRSFLDRFVALKDEAVKSVLGDFANASRNIKLHRMPWFPPARNSSQEILFQCWLLVDQNIARLDEGAPAPNINDFIILFDQSVEALEALSVPAGFSIDDAFARGCHYAASAKLVRCLHGILSMRATSESAPVPTCSQAPSTAQPSLAEPRGILGSLSYTEPLDFEQVFGEWENWPYNSTLDMLQSLQDTVFV